MPLINPETNENYTIDELSGVIYRAKSMNRQLTKTIKVKSDGHITNATNIDRKEGKLGIVSSKPEGAPATQIEVGSFKPVPITIPHYPIEVQLDPNEVYGQRVEGTKDTYLMPEVLLREKLAAGTQVLDAVEELQLFGAIRNQLVDDDGTLAADLSPLGSTTNLPLFDLADADFNVPAYFRQAKRALRTHLRGRLIQGWKVFVSPQTFEDTVVHGSVEKIYLPYKDAEFYRQDQGDNGGFTITTGVQIVEYEGEDLDFGNDIKLDADEFFMVPIVDGLFRRFYAPKRGNSTIHTKGKPRYASSYTKPHDAGEEVRMETNVVTFNEVPESVGIGHL